MFKLLCVKYEGEKMGNLCALVSESYVIVFVGSIY